MIRGALPSAPPVVESAPVMTRLLAILAAVVILAAAYVWLFVLRGEVRVTADPFAQPWGDC